MTIKTEIFNVARRKSNVSDSQYKDVDALIDFNEALLEIYQAIIKDVNDEHFWDYGLTSIVENQSEYIVKEFEVTGGDNLDINKIDRVLTKTSTGKYIPLPRIENSIIDVADNAITQRCYTIRDESIFIFPFPNKEIIDGIKIESIQTPPDLGDDDEVSSIQFPRQYHKALRYYLMSCAFGQQRNIQDEEYYLGRFNQEKRKLIRGMNGRTLRPVQNTSSNLKRFS